MAYFLYGVIYWLQLGEFLVPLPMAYFFVPIAGVLMFLRSIQKWLGSFIFLLLPVLVLKDLTLGIYPNVTGIALLVTLAVWTAWAWVVFYSSKERKTWDWALPLSQSLIWGIWLVPFFYVQVTFILLMLIGVTIFVRKEINNMHQVHHLRVALLIQLLIVLFFMQKISHTWVASA